MELPPNALTPSELRMYTAAETGRISLYQSKSEEIDELVLQCGANGYSYAQTAACVGVSTQTLKKWAVEFPQFAEILDRAHTLSQAWWEGRAMDGVANNLIGGNIWVRSMAARFPADYTERREDTQKITQTSTLDVGKLSIDTLRELAAARGDAD